MSTEILYPFQLTPSGTVAVTTSPQVQAQQHVTSLVSTTPGERVMLPGYGVSLAALVFTPDSTVVATTIQRDVTQALAQWEPSIVVNSVTPSSTGDPLQGVAMVNVDFQTGAMPGIAGSGIQTAVIEVGGTVVSSGS